MINPDCFTAGMIARVGADKVRYAQSGTSSTPATGARARRTEIAAGLNFVSSIVYRLSSRLDQIDQRLDGLIKRPGPHIFVQTR